MPPVPSIRASGLLDVRALRCSATARVTAAACDAALSGSARAVLPAGLRRRPLDGGQARQLRAASSKRSAAVEKEYLAGDESGVAERRAAAVVVSTPCSDSTRFAVRVDSYASATSRYAARQAAAVSTSTRLGQRRSRAAAGLGDPPVKHSLPADR